jgi:hypothetical protein
MRKGITKVICAYEVEEIATVAGTKLPPWAREVFPSVRAHMPLMDTEAGPVELLIRLDNTQWLLIHLEDSRIQEDSMRLMKSAFGHLFMIMGGWGTAFYPRDESMRYRGDLTGDRIGNVEETQEVRLQEYHSQNQGAWDRGNEGARSARARWSWGQSAGGLGRAAIRRPSPLRERTVSARGQRGTRGHQHG